MSMPKFEGRTVAGGRLKLNGLAEDVYDPLKSGQKIYVVIEADIDAVDHVQQSKGETLIRVHKAKIVRSGAIDTDTAIAILNQAEEQRAEHADRAAGREPLPLGDN